MTLPDDNSREALTPEEWSDGYDSAELEIRMKTPGILGDKRLHVCVRASPLGGTIGDQRDFLALAAFALHGSPWGFSAEDVKNLETIGETEATVYDWTLWARDLASRIQSLLPPSP